jgi:hypothetical protein
LRLDSEPGVLLRYRVGTCARSCRAREDDRRSRRCRSTQIARGYAGPSLPAMIMVANKREQYA